MSRDKLEDLIETLILISIFVIIGAAFIITIYAVSNRKQDDCTKMQALAKTNTDSLIVMGFCKIGD